MKNPKIYANNKEGDHAHVKGLPKCLKTRETRPVFEGRLVDPVEALDCAMIEFFRRTVMNPKDKNRPNSLDWSSVLFGYLIGKEMTVWGAKRIVEKFRNEEVEQFKPRRKGERV